jgi:hypothetical protein
MSDQEEISRMARELGLDVPVMAWRLVGGDKDHRERCELYLYGGGVAYYPPETPIDRNKIGDVVHPAVKDLEGMDGFGGKRVRRKGKKS